MNYYNIYEKRVNRYGLNYQSRIQNERERNFELYLLKSIYQVEFTYNDKDYLGSFEPDRQTNSKTLHYLLTYIDLNIPNGTILMIPDKDEIKKPWMVFYLEEMKASGYNRYVMLKMTHFIRWTGRDNQEHTSWAWMYGQENNMLMDEIRSRSRMDAIYSENLKSSFFVMPRNEFIKKDVYLEVGEEPFVESYRVTGYDIQSTLGVEFATIDPIYEYDNSPPPEQTSEDNPKDYFFLNGGVDE